MVTEGYHKQTQCDPRKERGKTIVETPDQIERLDEHGYLVKSQPGKGVYTVSLNTAIGWGCSCPDYFYREVKCKHVWACELSSTIRNRVKAQALAIQPVTRLACVVCGSDMIVKDAVRHNSYGDIQRYLCKSCGKLFSFNLGFDGMKASPQLITSAMQLYFTGESLRNIQKFLRLRRECQSCRGLQVD